MYYYKLEITTLQQYIITIHFQSIKLYPLRVHKNNVIAVGFLSQERSILDI